MKASDTMPTQRERVNCAPVDSAYVTDGAALISKSILPRNVVTFWEKRTGATLMKTDELAEAVLGVALDAEITTWTVIPAASYYTRERIVPNGVDFVTFDAPCFLALQSLTDSAWFSYDGKQAVFFKDGVPVAVLMGQKP